MKLVTEILDKQFEIVKLKNAAYGNSFMNSVLKFNLIAAIVRISDKVQRITTLETNPKINNNNESIKDSYSDLLNYCLMTIIYIKYGYLDSDKFIEYYQIVKDEIIDTYSMDLQNIEYTAMNSDLSNLFDEIVDDYSEIFYVNPIKFKEFGEEKIDSLKFKLTSIIQICIAELKYSIF